jgi:hypothetical protein
VNLAFRAHTGEREQRRLYEQIGRLEHHSLIGARARRLWLATGLQLGPNRDRPVRPGALAVASYWRSGGHARLFISAVVLFYFLFVVGTLLDRSWARWFGLTAVILNLLLVLSALFQGAAPTQALLWSVIPIILLVYIFSQKGLNSTGALNIQ